MYLNRSFLLALTAVILPVSFYGQSFDASTRESQYSERQYRYKLMQQRALDLSRRLSEMSGTEPIQLIDRNQSLVPEPPKSPAQRSYDSLPGPAVEPLPMPEDTTPIGAPVVYESEVRRVAPTNQQRKGDYYLMPFIGFAVSSTTTFSEQSFDEELVGDWGNSIGINVGKRWDNWMAYLRVAYQHLEYNSPTFMGSAAPTRIEGTEESYLINVGGGYSIPLTANLSTYGAMGVGFGWRRNSADVYFLASSVWYPDTDQSQSQSSMVFTYDLSMGLEYLFNNNFSAYWGYRLLGLTSNESFEGSFQHLLELGVGANF